MPTLPFLPTQLAYYDIYPKIVPVQKTVQITLHPRGAQCAPSIRAQYDLCSSVTHHPRGTFDPAKKYAIRVITMTETMEDYQCKHDKTEESPDYAFITPELVNGDLVFPVKFGVEQRYDLQLYENGEPGMRFSTYALNEDLFSCRPYRGDLHVHTCMSDGKEAPEYVAAVYRQSGFDFMAITDHHRYAPSLRAIDAYKDVPIDLSLAPGEEVHLPDNHIHIVNFGGDFSINDLCYGDKERYFAEVKEIEKTLSCPEGVDSFEYAACTWIYRQIEKGNGLGIFAHPHWIAYAYHVRDAMTEYQLKNKPFGAFELLGGQTVEENDMQLAFYHEMRAKGADIPIVGSSDSHGCINNPWPGQFNEIKTIVAAKSSRKNDIIAAIKAHHSVAVDEYKSAPQRIHGEYRMVSYAQFLLNNYFPLHDMLCFEEGLQMLRYISGEADAKDALQALHGRTQKLLDHVFADADNILD